MVKQLVQKLENQQKRIDHYHVQPGDKIKVHTRIFEGEKTRIQIFTGDVIAIKNGLNNNRTTITVRKSTGGHGVEKIFPLHSPMIEKIELVNRGLVRRGKLYYQRLRKGNAAKIKPKNIW
ncbi:MAG: 50S ribosomal protein L19 [bacterium]